MTTFSSSGSYLEHARNGTGAGSSTKLHRSSAASHAHYAEPRGSLHTVAPSSSSSTDAPCATTYQTDAHHAATQPSSQTHRTHDTAQNAPPATQLIRNEAPPGPFDMLPPPASTHPSWQALHDYAQQHASSHGYALSINTTAKNRSRIKLACVCYGQPKNTHKLTAETRVRKNRVSYKTGCEMWIEGKKQEDGSWVLRVGQGRHNHPGRAVESWAVQRKRTWGVAGARTGNGGVTAKEEKEVVARGGGENGGGVVAAAPDGQGDKSSSSKASRMYRLEQGGQVWKIVEQEMLRKGGEAGQGRDRGVGRTVEVLQAKLPGIHIFKRDVYNIRAQIKRLREAAGQEIGEGLQESEEEEDDDDGEAGGADEYDENVPQEQQPGRSDDSDVTSNRPSSLQIDPSLAAPQPVQLPARTRTPVDGFELEQLRQENLRLRELLADRTNELKEKTIEIAGLRSQIDYMSMLGMTTCARDAPG